MHFLTLQGELSLFELFAAIQDGEPVELVHMQPHQRAPVATAVAVMMVALRRHATGPLKSQADWEREWLTQIGPDALRLVAPEGEVGFFQPPLDAGVNRSGMTLSDVDLVFAKALHTPKPLTDGDAEQAAFALLSGAWSIPVVKWASGTRQSPSVVLPSDDATLGGEARHLIAAYEQHTPTVIGSQATPSRAADHLLWLRPVRDAGIAVDTVPYPYLEARPVHIVEIAPGRYAGIGQHSVPNRLAGKGHADDPHVPMIEGKPYRLWGGRAWSMRTQHEMLFGSSRTTRPPTLGVPGYRAVRICALGVDQGKTQGYWEALYPLSPRAAFSLTAHPQRAADLSQRALDAADAVDGALRWAVDALVQGSSLSAAVASSKSRASTALRDALTAPLTETVLARLGQPADPAAEQQALLGTAVRVLRGVWATIASGCPDPLAVAEGTARLTRRIKDLTGETTMDELPDLSKQVYAVLQEIAAHLTPAQRAALRTMLSTEPPLTYWMALAQVPQRLAAAPATEAVWRAVLPALGSVHMGGRGVGRALAQSGYPEMRMRQLLAATGETLVDLMTEVVRWLVAHEAIAVDLTTLATLGLADALGDEHTRAATRQRIALDFVRALSPKEAA